MRGRKVTDQNVSFDCSETCTIRYVQTHEMRETVLWMQVLLPSFGTAVCFFEEHMPSLHNSCTERQTYGYAYTNNLQPL